jgi:ribonuclease R
VVHRALIRAVKLGADGLPDGADARGLAEIAANISATERRAMKAEHETADRLIAHFLADRVGAIFDGHISGVTRAGLFVELDETGADGFITARTIGEEYFRFEEAARAFVGRSATYRLGDPVTVELVEAAPVAGALRFKIVSAPSTHSGGAPKRPGHPSHRRPKFARGRKSNRKGKKLG